MTTTLLMIFMAQGTLLDNILTYKYVALEITHTLMGSVGLVLVVPCTALSAVWFLAGRPTKAQKDRPGRDDRRCFTAVLT